MRRATGRFINRSPHQAVCSPVAVRIAFAILTILVIIVLSVFGAFAALVVLGTTAVIVVLVVSIIVRILEIPITRCTRPSSLLTRS